MASGSRVVPGPGENITFSGHFIDFQGFYYINKGKNVQRTCCNDHYVMYVFIFSDFDDLHLTDCFGSGELLFSRCPEWL